MLAVRDLTADETLPAPETAPDHEILGVAPGAVGAVWPHVLPFIERSRAAVPAMVAARELAEDIRARAERGVYHVWAVYRDQALIGAFVTSLDSYARLRVCTIQYLAGHDMDAWIDLLDATVCEWAAINGCAQVELRGRPGWGRKVERLGGVVTGIACVKGV